MKYLTTSALLVALCAVPADAALLKTGTANDPTGMTQYQSDGTTVIPIGGTAASTSVVFRAFVSNTNSSATQRLRVEVKPTSQPFTGTGTIASGSTIVFSGGVDTVTVTGLVTGETYHWRARTDAT